MDVPRLKSPEEIVEETADSETVYLPYRGLAEACTAAAGDTGVRRFWTPEERAGIDQRWPRNLFLSLKEERSWRRAAYLADAAESCLVETGSLDRLAELDLETGEIEDLRNAVSTALGELEVEGDDTVFYGDGMNGLQRSLMPAEAQSRELFSGVRELEPFRIFPSEGAISASVVENVERLGPESCAVVATEDSIYRSAVRSRLEARDIPFYSRRAASDNKNLRGFVSLLRAGTSSGRLRVREVRPLLERLGFGYPESSANAFLDSVDVLEGFRELLSVVENLTFSEVLERYEELTGPTGIDELLEELGLVGERVSATLVSRLRFYLESVEDGMVSGEGVAFVEPLDGGFVNRDAVFFLGMNDEWNPSTGDWPWTQGRERLDRSVTRGAAALQSGCRQLYMVQDVKMNREVTPCIQLQELSDAGLESFRDAPHRDYRPPSSRSGEGFDSLEVEVDPHYRLETDTISQNRLNDLAMSPRLFYISDLVSDAEDLAIEKGKLFHEFAEFYASCPSIVERRGTEEFAGLMMAELEKYADEIEMERLRTEVERGLERLAGFLGSRELDDVELGSSKGENRFAREYGQELDTGATEVSFRSSELGVRGKMDAVLEGGEIVDYKSGRSSSKQRSFRRSHPDLHGEERYPDFQPLMYLNFLRSRREGRLKFSYFYFLESLGEPDSDVEEDVLTLDSVDSTFVEHARTREFFRRLVGDVADSNDRRKALEGIGRDRFADFMEEADLQDLHTVEDVEDTEMAERLVELGRREVGDYNYVEDGMLSAARRMVRLRKSSFYAEDHYSFREFIERSLEELESYREEGFPVGERDVKDLPMRELILE